MWLAAACVLELSLTFALLGCVRGGIDGRIVALNAANPVTTALLLCLATGLHQEYLFDFALLSTLLGFLSTLIYARFLRRWL
jgi:multisubunit Na+/H+ antiporter MnhF subunit